MLLDASSAISADHPAGCHHPPEVADVAPMDGIGVMTEVIVGELLQPFQLGVDGGGTGEVGVEGGLLGVHLGLRVVIDDKRMNALFD